MASFASSYIKTEASQVTRSADSASMTGANFSSWYRQDEGTLYVEYGDIPSNNVSTRIVYSANIGSTVNNIQVGVNTSDLLNPSIVYNSSPEVSYNLGVNLSASKSAFGFKTNDSRHALNGSLSILDTSCYIPPFNQLDIGHRVGVSQINSTIKKLAFYPTRLTDANLQALTS